MNLALLTVGTGTAGRTSNLALGLRATVAELAPRRYWLAPSAAPDSQAMADLVREGDGAFAAVGTGNLYFTLPQHDDLDGCRRVLRAAIAQIRSELRSGERLVVNPTSGTKQMTAAAVLAALDEGVGDIVFTTGERADGVVITGTERLTVFDPAAYFRERDLQTARDLFSAGAFRAAARVLQPHRASLPHAYATAQICHFWRRLDYSAAVAACATGRADLKDPLSRRAQIVATGRPSLEILGDLLVWADRARREGDAEGCLAMTYKALEFAARFAFYELTRLQLPCSYDDLASCPLSREWLEFAAKCQRDNGIVAPGLWQVMTALYELHHPLGRGFAADPTLRKLTFARNATVHSIRPVSPREAQAIFDRVQNLCAASLPLLPQFPLPEQLPAT